MVYGAPKYTAARGDTTMDWSGVGRAFLQMEVDSLKLALDARPDFDRRYYEQSEQVYQRWLSEMLEAGIVSPTGVVISLVWLYGLLWARLPRPLRWAARSEEHRLNSSHQIISYAVFCLKKKKTK